MSKRLLCLKIAGLFLALLSVGSAARGDDGPAQVAVIAPHIIDRMNRGVNAVGTINTDKCEPGDLPEDWNRRGYGNTEIQNLVLYPPGDKTDYVAGFELDVVLVRGSNWPPDVILARYRKAAKILADKCQIKITYARLVTVDPPVDRSYDPPLVISTFEPGTRDIPSTRNFSEGIPTGTKRMTNFHVGALTDQDVCMSGPAFRVGQHSLRVDKQWLGVLVATRKFMTAQNIKEEFSAELHEMGHALLDGGHVTTPNFMTFPYSRANDDITREQCEKMKKHPKMRDLKGAT